MTSNDYSYSPSNRDSVSPSPKRKKKSENDDHQLNSSSGSFQYITQERQVIRWLENNDATQQDQLYYPVLVSVNIDFVLRN